MQYWFEWDRDMASQYWAIIPRWPISMWEIKAPFSSCYKVIWMIQTGKECIYSASLLHTHKSARHTANTALVRKPRSSGDKVQPAHHELLEEELHLGTEQICLTQGILSAPTGKCTSGITYALWSNHLLSLERQWDHRGTQAGWKGLVVFQACRKS